MTRANAGYRFVKRVWAFAAVGAVAVISSAPGSIFANSAADATPTDDRYATASVDAALAPSSPLFTSVSDVRSDDSVAPQTKSRNAFETSQVERIRMRVWGNSDLSGEYTIDPDNTLSVPRLGRIAVGGMTMADLEIMLTQKLSSAMRSEMTVAVEVARFRPYYIMGQIAEPGAIEWRPGLKVIQAISLAGGVLRSEDGAAHPVTSRQSRTQLTFSLAQLARLKAEREGGDTVATSERIATLISSVPETSRFALTNLISRQNDMLTEQRQIMDAQIVGLRREREAAERELEAADAQEKAVHEQLDITRAQLANIESLKEKKLVSNTRYLEQKSDLLMIEVRYSEIKSMVERARARLSSVDQQLVMVPQQRRATLSERIETLEREVAQLELVSGISTSASDDQNNILKLTYHISRESENGVQTLPATVFTEILAGDVLIVSEGQDKSGAVSNTIERPLLDGNEKDASAQEAQRRIEDAAIDPTQIYRRTSNDGRR